MTARVRPPRAGELELLRTIERRAGALFRDVPEVAHVADHEPQSVEELDEYRRAGHAWVAVEGTDTPVGYAIAEVVDGVLHLEQMSVDPAFGRRGLAAALLDAVCAHAHDEGRGAVTLTTYRDVPWNRPYYERHGFRVLEDHEMGPELRAVREEEGVLGLDPELRVCMRREVTRVQ